MPTAHPSIRARFGRSRGSLPTPAAPRRLNTALALALAAALGAGAAGCRDRESLASLPDDPTAVTVRQVRLGRPTLDTRSDVIEATGTIVPAAITKLMPLVPGIVEKLPVDEGDVVKRGQVLAVLDQRSYKLSLRQAQAAVEAARVGLEATEREARRFQKLLQEDATARAQYEQVQDRYRGAQAGMKQAKVALDMARKAVQDSVIRAPYAGLVIKKLSAVGDYATAMPPTVLLVLARVSTLELHVALPEPELPRVRAGVAVAAELPSLDRTVQARVTRVVRNVDPQTRSFTAIVEIDNADMKIESGLFARVKIKASAPRRRLLVPEEAVVDEGSGVFAVYVAEGDRARRKDVQVSAAGEGKLEVTSGLTAADAIILDPSGLADRDPIRAEAATAEPPPAASAAPGPPAARASPASAPARAPAKPREGEAAR